MNDTELFELCKEVYKRTRWDDDSLKGIPAHWGYCPLYTSDYLLEKLPKRIGSYGLSMWSYPKGNGVAYGYHDVLANKWLEKVPQRGDAIPLKALLKLVIALDDAGVKL